MSDNMELHCTTVFGGNRRSKLVFSIVAEENTVSSVTSSEYQLGWYALMRFKFHYTLNEGGIITTSVSLKLHSLQAHSNTQIKVTIQVGLTAKKFVCPQLWSEFFDMHQMRYIFDRDNSIVFAIPITITVETFPSPWGCRSLYSDDNFTDFQLSSETGTVPVHRAVMANHSEVFKNMLSGKWKETAKYCLEIEGVTQQTLQDLKDYMYLKSLPKHEDLRPLLLIAKCYMMRYLENACIDKLARSVTPENYLGTLEFAVDNRLLTLISCMVKNVSAKTVEDSLALTNLKLKAKE